MLSRLFATNKNPYIPGWNDRRRLDFDLSGVKFSIEVPYSYAPDAGAHSADSLINIFDLGSYLPVAVDLPDYERRPFRYIPLFNENWDVSGSIFSSAIGGFTFSAVVVKVEDLPTELACNRARDFMQIADRDMYFRYGPPNVNEYMPKVPIDWSVKSINDSDWLYYEAWPDTERYSDLADEVKDSFGFTYLKPISEQHFICISGDFGGEPPNSTLANYVRSVVEGVLLTSNISGASADVPLGSVFMNRGLVSWKEHAIKSVQLGIGEYTDVIDVHGTPAPTYKF